MQIIIDKNSQLPLIKQIYSQIRTMILEGKLQGKERLPSTRRLSYDLKVSRNVILEAYEELMAEGYIESKVGAGTFVAKELYFKRSKVKPKENSHKIIYPKSSDDLIDFRSGIPSLDMFPKKEWGSLFNKVYSNVEYSRLRYCEPGGTIELREAISKYLFRTRGINCVPEQIMIVSGSTQGLSLISKLLYSDGKEIIVEDPIHYGLLNVILNYGYSINPVEVDNKGMRTDEINTNNKVGFVYVTPSHQFPMGSVLPIQRRIELVKFAEEKNCYIVEDDYDSEIRYDGQQVSSLYELEPDRVIYIGSFSKILAPALRLGYIIMPDSLIPKYLKLKMYTDVHTESMSQLVLAKFIDDGKLERYIWKMRKEYAKKRKAVVDGLYNNFFDECEIEGQATGLHLVAKFKNILFTNELIKRILQQKVKVYPVEKYAINKGKHKNEIILGYGHLSVSEITEGINRLAEVIKM